MAGSFDSVVARGAALIEQLKATNFKDQAARAAAPALADECAAAFLAREEDREGAMLALASFAQVSLRCGQRARYFKALDAVLASGHPSKSFDMCIEVALQKALDIAAEMGSPEVEGLVDAALELAAKHGARPVVARAAGRTLQMSARFFSGKRDVDRVENVLKLFAARPAACSAEWLPMQALALADSCVFLLKIKRFDRSALVMKKLTELHKAGGHPACTLAYAEGISWHLAEDLTSNHLDKNGRATLAFELGLLAEEHAKSREMQVHLGKAAGGMLIAAFESGDVGQVQRFEAQLTAAARQFKGDAEVAFYVARAASSMASVLKGRKERREATAMDSDAKLRGAPRRLIAAAEASAPGNPQVADMSRKVKAALPAEAGMGCFMLLFGFIGLFALFLVRRMAL